ncbi:macrophage mannose receptor 1 [Myripristis murdjan]|uniref:macrophage mannose receptor 1 n=1 Tax=Myripristis murdjan TaxID=586833 RepID=UPI0011762E61|nr:macrophage mannose receptor 1-like [Myripristis murdjan]
MDHEVQTEPGLEVEEKHLAMEKPDEPEEPVMDLEPLSQDVPSEEDTSDDEMSKLEQGLRAEFLGQDAVNDLEPLSQEDGEDYLTAQEEPVMELEPEMMDDPFVSEPVVPEEPVEVMMRDENQEDQEVNFLVPPSGPHGQATKRQSCLGIEYKGKCYRFFRGPSRAAEAEFFCQDNFPNGHLAAITSENIHRQVMQMMSREIGGYTRTWVGGLRYLDTGRFIWLDGSRWTYADWLSGEPNDTAGVEDCVELLAYGNGKFNDMPCWDLRAFVCSYPL